MRPIYQHKRLFPNKQLRAICNFVKSELYADRTGNFNLTDMYYDPLPNLIFATVFLVQIMTS